MPPNQQFDNTSIEGMAPGETPVTVIHKHIFGIAILYIQAAIGLLAAFGLIAFLVPQFIGAETRLRYGTVLALTMVAIAALIFLVLIVATYIYRQNKLILSDKNVTQVLQHSLFNRQVSELSLSNVEDVTAEQRGIMASIFNFGELRIETAGEQNNFIFTYCPTPNNFGKIVLDARQRYVDGGLPATRSNDNPLPPAPPPPPFPTT